MTENIVQAGSRHVADIQGINRELIEKALRMRCLAYLSQVKSELLVETIRDMNHSRHEKAVLSETLASRGEELERQKRIIEQQRRQLAEQNVRLRRERDQLQVDVQEKSAAERQAREILARTQKLDSLGELSSGIAHDFNNILNVINGYAAELEKALAAWPELARHAREILSAGTRGAGLTRKLLAFSRKTASAPAVVDLNTVLRELHDMLQKTLTARIKLELALAEDLWPVLLDAAELEDAVVNLVVNAMHAIEGQGHIVIETQNRKLTARQAAILQLGAGDHVALCVRDDGVGMTAAVRKRIFEPFFTTKGDKGTGLGLSQVYGMVKRAGGSIEVESAPGKGASFCLYFPRHHGVVARRPAPVSGEQGGDAPAGNETILVVDDEPALRELCQLILEQQGYRVLVAGSGREALEILAREAVDLLLSDVVMPELNGFQLAALVRQQYPRVKVQLASGFTDRWNSGADDEALRERMIWKPYRAQELLRRVRRLLDADQAAGGETR